MKGVCIGAGYFSQFHYEAWHRIPEVTMSAACDLDASKVKEMCLRFAIPHHYTDIEALFDAENPDFVDIITPPPTHVPIIEAAARRGIHVIVQKPLAPDISDAKKIKTIVDQAGIRCMVHENFRWQPWHQELKKMITSGTIGDTLHSFYFKSRQGDGWGEHAYLDRQPYFRDMQRFLIHELGIHFIDTFQFLAGDIKSVFAINRQLNPVIKGEDCSLLIFRFANGAVGVWDANRYNESDAENPRNTFGDFLIEGNGGSIRLDGDGRIYIQKLGEKPIEHAYRVEMINFSGDCVFFTQKHFVDCMLNDKTFATDLDVYLKNITIEEALYQSAEKGEPVNLS
jgi:predicted dehydrogenase